MSSRNSPHLEALPSDVVLNCGQGVEWHDHRAGVGWSDQWSRLEVWPRTHRQRVEPMDTEHAFSNWQVTFRNFTESDLRRQNNMWICASDISTEWFTLHRPLPRSHELMSICSGSIGNDTINCDAAVSIGTASAKQNIGMIYFFPCHAPTAQWKYDKRRGRSTPCNSSAGS